MKRNTDPSFVGVEGIKQKQQWQLGLFQRWADRGEWLSIHQNHYDWWMFPIDEPSKFGFMWVVYEGDIAELKQDDRYIQNYLQGARLLARSWGWDVDKQDYILDPQPDQRWQHWPIRLYKCSKSLKLFGFDAYFESMKHYANDLMQAGEDMRFGRDLSWLFK